VFYRFFNARAPSARKAKPTKAANARPRSNAEACSRTRKVASSVLSLHPEILTGSAGAERPSHRTRSCHDPTSPITGYCEGPHAAAPSENEVVINTQPLALRRRIDKAAPDGLLLKNQNRDCLRGGHHASLVFARTAWHSSGNGKRQRACIIPPSAC